MYGATRSAMFFRTEVGIASAAEDLSRSRRINELISSTVVLRNVDSDDDDVIRVKNGGDESAVARRTVSTFWQSNGSTHWPIGKYWHSDGHGQEADRRIAPSTSDLTVQTLYANAKNQMPSYAANGDRVSLVVPGFTSQCSLPKS